MKSGLQDAHPQIVLPISLAPYLVPNRNITGLKLALSEKTLQSVIFSNGQRAGMSALNPDKVRVDISNEAYLDVVNAITTPGAPKLNFGPLQPSKVLEAVCRDYARIVRERISRRDLS